jgi:hypothetical protein
VARGALCFWGPGAAAAAAPPQGRPCVEAPAWPISLCHGVIPRLLLAAPRISCVHGRAQAPSCPARAVLFCSSCAQSFPARWRSTNSIVPRLSVASHPQFAASVWPPVVLVPSTSNCALCRLLQSNLAWSLDTGSNLLVFLSSWRSAPSCSSHLVCVCYRNCSPHPRVHGNDVSSIVKLGSAVCSQRRELTSPCTHLCKPRQHRLRLKYHLDFATAVWCFWCRPELIPCATTSCLPPRQSITEVIVGFLVCYNCVYDYACESQ